MASKTTPPAGGIRGRQGLRAVQGAPAGEADAGESSTTSAELVGELVYSAEGDVTPIGDLPAGEAERLEHLEAVIADGLQTFIRVGEALAEIRDRRLYRVEHCTFEDYCRARWGWSRQHAYRQIQAAEVARQMSPMGDTVPATERVARALVPVLEEERPRVWAEAQALAEAEGREVTAADVDRVSRSTRTRQANEAARAELLRAPADPGVDGLIVGDFRQHAARIADGSVELVFSDPPYDRESVPLYEAAAREAARILKPGGSALFYVGQSILPDVLDVVRPHLRYWWTAATLHAGATNLLNRLGIRCTFKPILWLVKETRGEVSRIVHDTASSPRQKDLHPWQQGLGDAEHFISALCPEGGTVVDFFAGSGTTAAAARRLGRRFVTFEVDPATAAVAAERLREAL